MVSPRKQGWTGGGVRVYYAGPGHPRPLNRPPGGGADWSRGSTSSFQRLRLTDILTGARPPRLHSWDHRPSKVLSAFPDSQSRPFLFSASRPCRPKESKAAAVVRAVWPLFRVSGRSWSQPSLCTAEDYSPGRRFTEAPGSTLCQPVWCVSLPLCKMGARQDEESPRDCTHHHGSDRLARDIGHLDDPNLATKYRSEKPAAKIPAAAPSG